MGFLKIFNSWINYEDTSEIIPDGEYSLVLTDDKKGLKLIDESAGIWGVPSNNTYSITHSDLQWMGYNQLISNTSLTTNDEWYNFIPESATNEQIINKSTSFKTWKDVMKAKKRKRKKGYLTRKTML